MGAKHQPVRIDLSSTLPGDYFFDGLETYSAARKKKLTASLPLKNWGKLEDEFPFNMACLLMGYVSFFGEVRQALNEVNH